MKKNTFLFFFLCFIAFAHAQIGIGTTTPEGALDVTSATNGILIPRVALTSKSTSAPVVNPNGGAIINGTLIYNTATAGVTPNNVVPGFYYWKGATWIAITGDGGEEWSLLGNSGTTSGTNFIGTKDNVDITFKRNNTLAGLLSTSNTSFGVSALAANTTGTSNTAFGNSSLSSNTLGQGNIAIGPAALTTNTSGNFNIAIGQSALNSNTASNNLAIGRFALNSNSTGIQNIAFGNSALFSNSSASNNIAIGTSTLTNNTLGTRNLAIGTSALTGNISGIDNIAIGNGGLAASTVSNNIAIGSNALDANTTGSPNLAIGVDALGATVTGSNNIGLGNSALGLNTGSGNVALGQTSGDTNTTGTNNTFVGYNSDASVASLNNATAIGANSVVNASNSMVLGNNANIGIGTSNPVYAKLQVVGYSVFSATNAGFTGSTSAAYIRGNDAFSTATTPDYSWYNSDQTGLFHPSSTVIGFCVNGFGEAMRINGSRLGIGTTTPNGLLELGLDQGRKPGTNTWTIVSDERLKNIDGKYTKGIKELMQLNPVVYHYKNVGNRTFAKEVLDTQYAGFTAQNVQKVFPEAVGTDPDGYLNLNTHAILIAYLNAFKEQQAQIEKLEKELEEAKKSKSEYDTLKAEVEAIKKSLKGKI